MRLTGVQWVCDVPHSALRIRDGATMMQATKSAIGLRSLVVAIDSEDASKRAIDVAIAIARRHHSELHFCHAVDHVLAIAESSSIYGGFDALPLEKALDGAASDILSAAVGQAQEAGVAATMDVLDGRAAPAIIACAQAHAVDAIILGTQGKTGLERVLLGSTAADVLRRATMPVFVVPPGVRTTDSAFETILVGVDDSDPSDAAATFATGLAHIDRAKLVLCGVAHTTELYERAAVYGYDPVPLRDELNAAAAAPLAAAAERADDVNVACERLVVNGDPTEELLHAADRCGADLIVVGTHGRRGVRRMFVGSVAEAVVNRSSVPVVVVRPTS
jgi:nucleotide-binding universal stress UspA family protein